MTRKHTSLLFLMVWFTLAGLSGQDTLLLFHPTAYNLEVFQLLMDDDLLDLEGYHLLGVYHEKENYDYGEASAYIELHQARHMSILKVTGTLNPGNLFMENECSVQFKRLFSRSKGALFMGGPDIPPAVYKEPVHLLTEVTDPFRHYLESSYLFHLLGGFQDPDWVPWMVENEHYLVSGICLGMQTMNVATGGTMVQDIPTELYGRWIAEEVLALPPDQVHRNYNDKLDTGSNKPTSYHFHPVKAEKKSFLHSELGVNNRATPLVLSSHHQALEKLGKGWVIAATSMDGRVIEAIEHERFPNVFGVQFHPEKPGLFDPSIEHQHSSAGTINFQETIRGTQSYAFHLEYWKFMGTLLQKNREPN